MATILYIDWISTKKRIVIKLDSGDNTKLSVQELYSRFKEELQNAPVVHEESPYLISGGEDIDGVSVVGMILTLKNDWYIDCGNAAASHTIKINRGIIRHQDGTSVFLGGTNIRWEVSENTVDSILSKEQADRLTAIEDNLGIFNEREMTSDGTNLFKIKSRTNAEVSLREYDVDSETAPKKVTPKVI